MDWKKIKKAFRRENAGIERKDRLRKKYRRCDDRRIERKEKNLND